MSDFPAAGRYHVRIEFDVEVTDPTALVARAMAVSGDAFMGADVGAQLVAIYSPGLAAAASGEAGFAVAVPPGSAMHVTPVAEGDEWWTHPPFQPRAVENDGDHQ